MSIFTSVPSFLRSRAPVTPDSSPSTSAVLCSNSTSMLGGVEHPLLHRLRGAQVGLADDHVDLAAERGQIRRLLAGRVAAADHRHVLLAVEEPVAGGAGADALAAELGFEGESEVFGRGSRGDDERLGLDLPGAVHDHVGTGVTRGPRADGSRADVGAEALGLPAHPVHQVGARDAVGMPGKFSTSVVVVSCPPGSMPS